MRLAFIHSLLGTVLLVLLALPAGAADLYRVGDVPVDATAATTTEARARALAAGQREAVRRLVARLVPLDSARRLPNLSQAQLDELIRAIDVSQERSSATRYLARLGVVFRPDSVRAWLRDAGLPYSETVARPSAVVPVLMREAEPVLWADPNPWREAWTAYKPDEAALLPLMLPVGDLEDVSAVTAEQAAAGNETALRKLAARHGAAAALVVRAEPAGDRVTVTTTRLGDTAGALQTIVDTYPLAGSDVAAWSRVVEDVVARLTDEWKHATQISAEGGGELRVVAPLTGLADFTALRQKLAETPQVESVELVSVSRERAEFRLTILGDTQRLAIALASRDLLLSEQAGTWELRRR